jgi:hypothetical protein
MLAGSGTADCVKPWAILDKWTENQTPAWDPSDSFSRYVQNGRNRGSLVPNPDVYTPPTAGSSGTAFSLPTDYGTRIEIKTNAGGANLGPGWWSPIVILGTGGSNYRTAIETCATFPVVPGQTLVAEPGNMVGPTRQGVDALVAQDPGAYWSASANGGRGGVVGGCMASGACSRSPRLGALPVVDPDAFTLGASGGRTTDLFVTQVLGFWIEGMVGNDVIGYITYYPTVSLTGAPLGNGASAFARTVILVR